MLSKRIIACLDVRDGQVVKGIQFRNHKIVGDILTLAQRYAAEGADELVFYDITASSDDRVVDNSWIRRVAQIIDIPFCVAGGIRTVEQARAILNDGADKISINSPALERPTLISEMADAFGVQCVVVGIDSRRDEDRNYKVYQYTGDSTKTVLSRHDTLSWVQMAQDFGAGEIVLNCMNQDGMRKGYDIEQLKAVRAITTLPLIASGGAGTPQHFADVFKHSRVDGGLAASIFHEGLTSIPDLKHFLKMKDIVVRL